MTKTHEQYIELLSCALRARLSTARIRTLALQLDNLSEIEMKDAVRVLMNGYKPAYRGQFPSIEDFEAASLGYIRQWRPVGKPKKMHSSWFAVLLNKIGIEVW